MKDKRWNRKFALAPLFIAVFLFGFSALVMLLWNAVLPKVIAGVSPLNYWQAMAILVLSKILFGRGGPPHGAPFGWMRMREKLKHMSPEEREKFREQMQQRFGYWQARQHGWDYPPHRPGPMPEKGNTNEPDTKTE